MSEILQLSISLTVTVSLCDYHLQCSLFSAVLQINFGESDYSIGEGFSRLSSQISLTFRANQNPFSVTLTPVTIDIAENMSLGDFINSDNIQPSFRATEGVCF